MAMVQLLFLEANYLNLLLDFAETLVAHAGVAHAGVAVIGIRYFSLSRFASFGFSFLNLTQ